MGAYPAGEPDLAESFEATEGGRLWTFKLREGVQFHGGYGELKASDVKFTFDRVRNPDFVSPWLSQFTNVEEILVLDDYTVQVVLEEADPLFLINIAGHTRGAILNERAVTELGSAFRTNPIGTGPFQFDDYVSTQSLRVTRFDDYFRADEAAILEATQFHYGPEVSSLYIGLQRGDYDVAGGVDTRQFAERTESLGLNVISYGLGASVALSKHHQPHHRCGHHPACLRHPH